MSLATIRKMHAAWPGGWRGCSAGQENEYGEHVGLPLVRPPHKGLRASMIDSPRMPAISISLVLVALAGCKRDLPLTCEAVRYLEPADGGQSRVKPIMDPNWDAVEVPAETIQSKPKYIRFQESDRVIVDWLSYGHVWTMMELVYLPKQAKARIVKPESNVGVTHPLVVWGEGRDRRLRFGFFSALCKGKDSAPRTSTPPK